MSTIDDDLNSFSQFVKTHADSAASVDTLFDTWRVQNPAEVDLAAIKASLKDLDGGERGVAIEEFNESMGAKHKLN